MTKAITRKKIPEMIIDRRLYDAIKVKQREIGNEIQARIDFADAVQFILGDALDLCIGTGACDWVLQESEKP